MRLNITYKKNYISPQEERVLFDDLLEQLDWHREELTLYGRKILVPRCVSFYGDDHVRYVYSRQEHCAQPWPEMLWSLCERLRADGYRVNSVLCNLYRNGFDYMGWHADDEEELGPDPVILSISLGASRDFIFRHKKDHAEKVLMCLEAGSLLVMSTGVQLHWEHCLPKRLKIQEPRINLTFRWISLEGQKE